MRCAWWKCGIVVGGWVMVGGICAADGEVTTQQAATQAATQGAMTQGADSDARWGELLGRLESAEYAERAAARAELEKVPIEEQDRLKKLAAATKSAEVRAVLEGRLEEMKEQLAVDPPAISISVKDATLAEVAKALSDATGASLPSWPPAGMGGPQRDRFTLEAVREPYWDVFCKLSAQHGLQLQQQQQPTLMMTQPGWQRCVRAGGVAIFPGAITRQAVVNLQAPPGQQVGPPTLSLSYTMALDPRVKVAAYGGIQFSSVVDDAGNVLHSQEDKAPQFWRRGRNQWGWMESVPLTIPEKLGTRVTSAKGVVHLTVELAEVTTEVAEIEKNWKTPVNIGGMTVTFSAFDAPGDRLNFSLQVNDPHPVVVNRGSRAADDADGDA